MTKFIGPPAPRARLDYRARRLARGALMQRYLRLILTIMAAIPAGSSAQTPPPAIEGPVYVATYVEVVPTAADEGAALLKQYRDASRKDAGNQRFEVQQQGNRPNHFTVVEIWADKKAYDAHVMAGHTRLFRDKLGPMSGALYDERLYQPLE